MLIDLLESSKAIGLCPMGILMSGRFKQVLLCSYFAGPRCFQLNYPAAFVVGITLTFTLTDLSF